MSYQRKEVLAEGVELYLGDCRRLEDELKRPPLFIPSPAPKAKQESLL